MNWELPDVQSVFWKGRETRDQNASIHWVIEKARQFQKNICFIEYAKAFDYVIHNKQWKLLTEMRITDHLTCLLRNLYASQEAAVRTGHATTDCLKLGKEYVKTVYCHPAYRTYLQSTLCWAGCITSWNQGCWEKNKQPQICGWYHSNGRKWRGTKEPLDEVEREEWKSWLKTQHLKN